MNVAVVSMFRDATAYLDRYFAQVIALRVLLEAQGDRLRVVAVENNSTDDTWDRLSAFTHNELGTLVEAHDDCPYWPSVDVPDRWRHLAWVQNHTLTELDDGDDIYVYVESDLTWDPTELLALIGRYDETEAWSVPIYSKVRGGRYYDSWGSRMNGTSLAGRAPYHPDWKPEPMVMDSVAAIIVCSAQVARQCRFSPEDGVLGFCRDLKSLGVTIMLDPALAAVHP